MLVLLVLAIIGVLIYFRFKGTAYAPKGVFGGYSDLQLGSDMFEVKFQGNGNTGSDKSIDLCMLRCGELTLQNGYNYFFILDGRSGNTGVNINAMASHPASTNTIKLFKEKPADDLGFYDANFVVSSFKKKYNLK